MALAFAASTAHAHPAPAEPPRYAPAPCITRADANAEELLRIDYDVAFDDVALDPDDIPTSDARTHQFFALRGALVQGPLGYELVPFEVMHTQEERIVLPTWVSMNDLERSEAATAGTAIVFEVGEVPANALIDTHPSLATRVQRIDADDARRPITHAQAEHALSVELSALAQGPHTIAAYIFSPPFNGWAPRPGLVNVVREEHLPAAQLDPIAGVLRGGQGRPLHACVDAPEGSSLRGAYFAVDAPERGWQEFLPEQRIVHTADTSELALCFQSPDASLSGSVRVRLELRGPDGATFAAYSPDTLTALPGEGACEPSATVCCRAGTDTPDASAPDATAEAAPNRTAGANCTLGAGLLVPNAHASRLYAGLALLAALRARRRGPIC